MPRKDCWAPAAAIVVLTWSQFAWVSATNFLGHDEWLILSLTSRGIVSFPYANRPLAMLWNLPASLFRDPLTAHYVLHGTYLSLTGVLVFLLVRRLAPEQPVLAWMAGAFAATWAPADLLRLDSVQMLIYSGFMVGLLAAHLLLLLGWSGRRWWAVAAASVLALVTLRGYEGVLPLLLGGPLVLAWLAKPRPGWTWVLPWYGALAVGGLQMVGAPAETVQYQTAFERDLHPLHVAGRLLEHYGFELLPLIQTPRARLAAPAAIPTLALFWVALTALFRREVRVIDRRRAAAAIAVGLAVAGLGSMGFAAVPSLTAPLRAQFLPAPGIGLFLAGLSLWLASWLPQRWRLLGVAALGGWVMWVGTACVLALQRHWDMKSLFPQQNRLLRELTRLAPDLRPNTLVILVDRMDAWRPFAFQHAIEYMYEGRASGLLWGPLENFLMATTITDGGVVREPLPAIRGPWRSPPTFHRYDEVVLVRYSPDGAVTILDKWLGRVGPLPAGAFYAPQARIVRGGAEPLSRAVLR